MILKTSQLPEVGLVPHALGLTHIARGWWATDDDRTSATARALAAGGRLTCLSGLETYGVWTPPYSGRHVAVPSTWKRPRAVSGVMWHRSRRETWTNEGPVQDVVECLDEVVRHHDATTAHIVLDSALHRRLIDHSDLDAIMARAPYRKARALRHVDGSAESGTETVVRLWLQQHRLPVRPQVRIRSVGRVDLLVGSSLIIECDSEQFHTSVQDYANDRRRDLAAQALGYRVVRLTWAQVMLDFETTAQCLLSLVGDRAHQCTLRAG